MVSNENTDALLSFLSNPNITELHTHTPGLGQDLWTDLLSYPGEMSKSYQLTTGVPQGSVLGLLIFSVTPYFVKFN